MKKPLSIFYLMFFLFLGALLPGNGTLTAPSGFFEDFSSSTLDPAWQVVEFTGTRVYNCSSPANHISLTERPGYLRYYLDPMTHYDGFVNNFQTMYYGYGTPYHYDPGLELRREFCGDRWIFEAKAEYYIPYTNGRRFDVRIYFGDGSVPTYLVDFMRNADVNGNSLRAYLWKWSGNLQWPPEDQLAAHEPDDWYWGYGQYPETTIYWRLEREGGLLIAQYSEDGITWNPTFTYDLGNQIAGMQQWVVVTGLCWFNTAGSYADWDYIQVEPTIQAVEIDIKPGSDPNSINLGCQGNVPVAIFSTPGFDATNIDPLTVTLAGASVKLKGKGTPMASYEDIIEDGLMDIVVHVDTTALVLSVADTEAVLEGETFDGVCIRGTDTIRIVND